MGSRLDESICRDEGWQDGSAAFHQNSLITCFTVVIIQFCIWLPNCYVIYEFFILVGDYTRHNVRSIDGGAGYAVSWTLVSSLYNRCCSQLCRCRYIPEPQCFKPSSVTVINTCTYCSLFQPALINGIHWRLSMLQFWNFIFWTYIPHISLLWYILSCNF